MRFVKGTCMLNVSPFQTQHTLQSSCPCSQNINNVDPMMLHYKLDRDTLQQPIYPMIVCPKYKHRKFTEYALTQALVDISYQLAPCRVPSHLSYCSLSRRPLSSTTHPLSCWAVVLILVISSSLSTCSDRVLVMSPRHQQHWLFKYEC